MDFARDPVRVVITAEMLHAAELAASLSHVNKLHPISELPKDLKQF